MIEVGARLGLYLVDAILVKTRLHLFGGARERTARTALAIGLDLFAFLALQRWTCLPMANVGRILSALQTFVTNTSVWPSRGGSPDKHNWCTRRI